MASRRSMVKWRSQSFTNQSEEVFCEEVRLTMVKIHSGHNTRFLCAAPSCYRNRNDSHEHHGKNCEESSTDTAVCSRSCRVDLGDGRVLVRVSGFGPDDTNTDTSSSNELATLRFSLEPTWRVVTSPTMHRTIPLWVRRLRMMAV
jgi:hypothetical protein